MSRSKIIAGVEIGTSKVSVLVGEVLDGRKLSIIGHGQSTSMGVRKGEIFDLGAASDCTHAAIMTAESNANAQIEEVYMAQTGAHLSAFSHSGLSTISSNDGRVCPADIRQAVGNAKGKLLNPGRIYIHHIRTGYLLDNEYVTHPMNLSGQHLEARYWHVHGDERRLKASLDIIRGIGLHVQDIIVSSLAAGTISTSETEKDQGVLVVDIGCGTTDYVLYKGGRVHRTGVIPVGGDHITNDLSLGLRIRPKYAENLKKRDGKALYEKIDKGKSAQLIGDLTIGDQLFPLQSISKIIQVRLEELFMILKNKLGSALSDQVIPAGVVLTGGVSQLPMICELAESTLGVQSRLGVSPDWVTDTELKGPEYSAVLGLLYYGLKGQQGEEDQLPKEPSRNIMKKFVGIFK